jgi:hypothetical protein
MPCAYWEDVSKKDQGQAFLDGGSKPLEPDEDGPAIMVAVTPMAGEDGGTYKNPECSCMTSDAVQPNSTMDQKGRRGNTV